MLEKLVPFSLRRDLEPTLQAASELRRLHIENVLLHDAHAGDNKILQDIESKRDELLEALRMNAQSLAWLAHGECRTFHPNLPTADASLDAACSAITKVEGGAA